MAKASSSILALSYNVTTSTATRQPKAAHVSVSRPAANKYLMARVGFCDEM